MLAQITNPLIFLGLAASLSAILFSGLTLWRLGRQGWIYSVLTFAVGVWSLLYVLQLGSPVLETKLFWLQSRNALTQFVVLAWLAFCMEYAGREEWLDPRRFALPAFPSAVLAGLVWANPMDSFVVSASVTGGGLPLLDAEFGLVFWLAVGYAYFLVLLGVWYLVLRFRESFGLYRKQVSVFVLAAVPPVASSVLFVANQSPYFRGVNPLPNVELTPYALAFSVVVLGLAMFNYRLFDLVPIARSTVVEKLEDGVIVLDREDTVVDVNEAAARMVGMDERELLGSSIGDVLSQYSEVVQHYRGVVDRVNDEIVIDRGGVKRHLDLNISPIGGDRQAGRVVLLRDVTRRKRNEEELRRKNMELERQNEQLDEFAAVVSHDLRNPLNVVEGYLPMARDGDPEAFEAIDESVDRMKEIVDDVLMLARQGQSVTETVQVDLDGIAYSAWSNVDTGGAELVVRTGAGVEADRARLLHVFENLYRNSVEHGGAGVRIEVGPLEDGFYVEDDGPGIPEGERWKVLEHGYTTSDGGTGFGLSIVRSIVEAHGWEIEVTESSEGGARFEITGVEESPVGLD